MSLIRYQDREEGAADRQGFPTDCTQHHIESTSSSTDLELVQLDDSPNDSDESWRARDIASNGDVVLIVGPEKVRLKVHSLFLSSASKMFRTLFESELNLFEGQGRSGDLPKELVLEKDHAMAMNIICCVLHHKADEYTWVAPSLLLEIAILANKYGLVKPLKLVAISWLRCEAWTAPADIAYLVLAAYLLEDKESFSAHCQHLILDHSGSFMRLLPDKASRSHIALKIFCSLEERRNGYRLGINGMIFHGSDLDCDCPWNKKLDKAYSSLRYLFTPIPQPIRLSQIIEEIKAAVTGEIHLPDCLHFHSVGARSELIRDMLVQMNMHARICFDCVEGENNGVCTHEHDRALWDPASDLWSIEGFQLGVGGW